MVRAFVGENAHGSKQPRGEQYRGIAGAVNVKGFATFADKGELRVSFSVHLTHAPVLKVG